MAAGLCMRRLQACLRQYRQPGAPAPLRRTAFLGALQLALAEGGADACIDAAVDALAAERSPAVRWATAFAARIELSGCCLPVKPVNS